MEPGVESRLTDALASSPDVREVDSVWAASRRDSFERQLREESVLAQLRGMLRRRHGDAEDEGDEPDRYEPQRLTRKIHWQYDGQARKVPLLRRPYI